MFIECRDVATVAELAENFCAEPPILRVECCKIQRPGQLRPGLEIEATLAALAGLNFADQVNAPFPTIGKLVGESQANLGLVRAAAVGKRVGKSEASVETGVVVSFFGPLEPVFKGQRPKVPVLAIGLRKGADHPELVPVRKGMFIVNARRRIAIVVDT